MDRKAFKNLTLEQQESMMRSFGYRGVTSDDDVDYSQTLSVKIYDWCALMFSKMKKNAQKMIFVLAMLYVSCYSYFVR